MFCFRLSLLGVFLGVCATVVAEEQTKQPRITGNWNLTEFNEDHSESKRTGKITPIPSGVGYRFVEEEFFVPGEMPGSNRYTLSKGVHFRISPARIDDDSLVVDILLAHTKLVAHIDDGFSASSKQTDGRHVMKYGKPVSVSLQLPDNRRYELVIVVVHE